MMLPLSDLLVLDLSRVLSGPYCSMYLSDFGARVIKIERPAAGDAGGDDTRAFGPPFVAGESTYFMSVNRNKESVVVDLKAPAGQELVRRLARRADVLVENFRPGVTGRLGLSYAQLRQDNPGLIYCSISGFGSEQGAEERNNPWTGKPGYDVVIQGMGGFASLTGDPDRPPLKAGIAIADLTAGLNAVIGILVALHARHRTGRGQHVDVSMLDGQVALLSFHAGMYLNAGKQPRRMGNRHPSIAPYETYRTADGFINIAAANDGLWRSLCQVLREMGLSAGLSPPPESDARFATNPLRVQQREALSAVLDPLLCQKTTAEWLSALEARGIPCGPILGVPEVLAHPQVQSRGMVVSLPHPALAQRGGPAEVRVTGVPIRLSLTPGEVHSAPPLLGQHTAQVLREVLGMPEEELRELQEGGVIAGTQ